MVAALRTFALFNLSSFHRSFISLIPLLIAQSLSEAVARYGKLRRRPVRVEILEADDRSVDEEEEEEEEKKGFGSPIALPSKMSETILAQGNLRLNADYSDVPCVEEEKRRHARFYQRERPIKKLDFSGFAVHESPDVARRKHHVVASPGDFCYVPGVIYQEMRYVEMGFDAITALARRNPLIPKFVRQFVPEPLAVENAACRVFMRAADAIEKEEREAAVAARSEAVRRAKPFGSPVKKINVVTDARHPALIPFSRVLRYPHLALESEAKALAEVAAAVENEEVEAAEAEAATETVENEEEIAAREALEAALDEVEVAWSDQARLEAAIYAFMGVAALSVRDTHTTLPCTAFHVLCRDAVSCVHGDSSDSDDDHESCRGGNVDGRRLEMLDRYLSASVEVVQDVLPAYTSMLQSEPPPNTADFGDRFALWMASDCHFLASTPPMSPADERQQQSSATAEQTTTAAAAPPPLTPSLPKKIKNLIGRGLKRCCKARPWKSCFGGGAVIVE